MQHQINITGFFLVLRITSLHLLQASLCTAAPSSVSLLWKLNLAVFSPLPKVLMQSNPKYWVAVCKGITKNCGATYNVLNLKDSLQWHCFGRNIVQTQIRTANYKKTNLSGSPQPLCLLIATITCTHNALTSGLDQLSTPLNYGIRYLCKKTTKQQQKTNPCKRYRWTTKRAAVFLSA